MNPGEEPIEDDEILYRRIPLHWYSDGWVDNQAFLPNRKRDEDGLSLFRAKYKTPEEVATTNRSGKKYHVAVLLAANLRAAGLRVESKPLPDDPGHCVLPDLVSVNRSTSETREKAMSLALALTPDDILGPFGPFT